MLALAGSALSSLDLLAPHALVPDTLSVYYFEGDTLCAVSAATGAVRWCYTVSPASYPPIPPPLVDHGVVYLSGIISEVQSAGVALAMDVRTGRERWRTVLESADVFISLAGQMLYVGGANAYGLRASDGHIVWRYDSGAQSRAQFYQPVVAAGVVFVGSGDVGFHFFGIGSNNFLNALDARTGQLYWRTSFVADDLLLVSS